MKTLKQFDFFYVENRNLKKEYKTLADFEGEVTQEVVLPHDVALSVSEFGGEHETLFGTNVCKLQEKENLHCYYFCKFKHEIGRFILRVNRVDVYSEIYLNGEKVMITDNAFISFEQEVDLKAENELVIHLLPAMIKAREMEIPAITNMLQFSYPAAYMRKPIHLLGWDIFPRNALGGIFDAVVIDELKTDEIKSVYVYTNNLNEHGADLLVSYFLKISGDQCSDYEIEIKGRSGDSEFYYRKRLWFVASKVAIHIDNPKVWNVKNHGKPNLYDFTVTLYKGNKAVDEYRRKIGVRRIELVKSNDENGGRFDFIVNGKRTFIKGINWVPLSTFHSLCVEKMPAAFAYLQDLNVNMVRVWGGGYYETEEFYNFCDENGILVWQDFMMACGIYPWNEAFSKIISAEVEQVVKRLRNHPSLALWSGDNECDMDANRWDSRIDPNRNIITRRVIADTVYLHDVDRSYLPSSPYIDGFVFKTKSEPSEAHTWGPRNFFKSDYYTNIKSAFVSENGYMGFPCVPSLKRFIPQEKVNDLSCLEYTIHSSNPAEDSYFNFRMKMVENEIIEMLGYLPQTIEEKVLACQIAEAEADKFFVEYMRCRKNDRGGILIWNLIDGWPQVSDSLVDYYGVKKLAYGYMQNSYRDFALMIEEKADSIELYAVNDTLENKAFFYELKDVEDGSVICAGNASVKANEAKKIDQSKKRGAQSFIDIKWVENGTEYHNHFVCDIKLIDINKYLQCAKKLNLIADEYLL